MKTIIAIAFFLATLSASAQVGIGTTSPNSTLDVRGSLSVGYRSFSASTTAASTDNALAFSGVTAATLTLPDASACTGRIYSVKNISTTLPTPVLTIATTSSQTIDGSTSWVLDGQNQMLTLVSNGTNWVITTNSSAKSRSNYVLVKSSSDFPAAVNGVISLTANTLYEINGTITLTDKINLNGCTVIGRDKRNDKLIYTPTTGELFTGSSDGTLSYLTLSATGTGSKLFNLDAGGDVTKSLTIEFCAVRGCDNIGLIKGYGGVVVFLSTLFMSNLNGIILQDLGSFAGYDEIWTATNRNTFEKFIGSFGTIQKIGGIMQTLSFYSAKALDISGITSITDMSNLKLVSFSGTGTYVVGSFSDKWEVESTGLNTEKDDVATGNMYISASAATTFTAINTPVKILGTTTFANLFRVTGPSNNNLTYTGTKSKKFFVICALSIIPGGANKSYSLYISKNGVVLPESKQSRKTTAISDLSPLTLSCIVLMNTNDYIEVWAENNTDATAVTVQTLNLAIK